MINKNYFFEPIIDNKYYISEKKSYEIIKEVDNGYLVKNKKNKQFCILTYGSQGYYYKDYDAFNNDNGVCYIPEYNSTKENENALIIPTNKKNENIYYRKDILDAVKRELNSSIYRDLFNKEIPSKLIENIAIQTFEIIDWQHPESYLSEVDWDEDIIYYFSNNKDDIDKYASNELKEMLNYRNETYNIVYND